MTLNNIFDNLKYGEDYTKNKVIKEGIEKCYDNALDIFYASKRVKDIANKMSLTEGEELKVNRIISKLVVLEDRLETGKPMSDAYRTMQSTAIMEDCNALQNEITKTRKVDSTRLDNFGRMIATTKYFVESRIDEKAVLKESTNPLLNKYIKEDVENINKCFN